MAKSHNHAGGHDNHMTLTGPAWLPLAIALILGLAALVAGLTAWRAAVHLGNSQVALTFSTQSVNNANTAAQDSNKLVSDERSMFIVYEEALQQGDTLRAQEIRALMAPSTQKTIDWWLNAPASNRPASPFSSANPEWITPRKVIDTNEVLDLAEAELIKAEDEIHQAHSLELLEAILAIAFLTGGLTATLRSQSAQFLLLSVSATVLVISAVGLLVLW